MRITDIPAKIPKAFAVNGDKNAIPTDSTTTEDNEGVASLNRGFPPITMMERGAGGIPPDGKDLNGILFAISDVAKWVSAGMGFPFDQSFANTIGGYPKGAVIPNSTSDGFWQNTVEQNTNNPEVSGATLTSWVPHGVRGTTALSGLSSSSVTLSTNQAAKPRITLSGTLTASINLILPAWPVAWTVINNCTGNFQVIVKTPTGTGVTVATGETAKVIGDGTNIVKDFGSAAMRDAGTSPGNLMPVGAFGLGSATPNVSNDFTNRQETGFYRTPSAGTSLPSPGANYAGASFFYDASNKAMLGFRFGGTLGLWARALTNGTWQDAIEILTTASPVPVANGGTGAADADGARTNLSVYSRAQLYTRTESDSRFNSRNSGFFSPTQGRHVDNSTGFIIQIGRVTRTADLNAVTFPLAFPNACIGVLLTKNESAAGPNSEANMAAINQTYNGFTALMYSEERGATWVAIGY